MFGDSASIGCRLWALSGVVRLENRGAATIGGMTDDLFRADAYLRTCESRIVRLD
jgi:misacylated tRNA(Ala) deacylase